MTTLKTLTALVAMTFVVACGNADNNDPANNGETNNGATNNGATNNGATNNGATNNGATNNGATNNGATNNGATNNAAPSFADDVAPILLNSCALAGCHLDPGNGTAFVIGAGADVAAVQTALDGVATAGGTQMVVGGDLDNSEIYLRVTGTGRARMPFGGELTPPEIDIIEAWIQAGASF